MRYLIQRCAAVVIGFWLCSGSAAAWADWQYTKWGMTEPQVVAASTGAAGRVAPKDVKGGRRPRVALSRLSCRLLVNGGWVVPGTPVD